MSDDFERLFERAARRPSRPLDISALGKRSRKARAQKAIAVGTACVLLAGGGAFLFLDSDFPPTAPQRGVDVSSRPSREGNAQEGEAKETTVSFDADYASDFDQLLDFSTSILRVRAIGDESYVDGVEGGEEFGYYRQEVSVLDVAWGDVEPGSNIAVLRVDISPEYRGRAQLSEEPAGPFEPDHEYALLLRPGVEGTAQGSYHLLAGEFQGFVPIVDGKLYPQYPRGDSQDVSRGMNGLTWDEFKRKVQRYKRR